MKRILSAFVAVALAFGMAACGAPAASTSTPASSAASSAASASASSEAATEAKPTQDRSGAAITLPDNVETVISMAPSITQTLMDLGCTDQIIALDTNSAAMEGAPQGLPAFDMMTPDAEQMATLAPDVIFVSSISSSGGENPFQPLQELGTTVVCIPTSASIEDIYEDVTFLGQVMGKTERAAEINENLKAEIDRITALGASIPEDQRKTVYFEIAAAPSAYSTGSGTYMDEMINLIGANNMMADKAEGWTSVDSEVVVSGNPDVILTNVDYLEDPVGEIKSREGWEAVTAVKNGDVYQIDNMASSLPNENIVSALEEMGKAVYPEVFGK